MRKVLVFVALLACSKDKEGGTGGTVVVSSALADLSITPYGDFKSTYDAKTDSWQLTSPAAKVVLERADERYVQSPDAFMNQMSSRYPGKLVTIEARDNVRAAGFAMTLGVYAGEKDPNPLHVTVVVGQLGKLWYQCLAENLDENTRSNVVAMCRSVHL
jgi:hypothetical protein